MANNEDEETLKSQLCVIELGELLDEGKVEDAKKLFEEAHNRGDLVKNLWEIIPVIIARLTSTNKKNNNKVFSLCEKLLEALADECNPKETLLLFVEHIDGSHDPATFRSLLKPLGASLLRVGPSRAIDWCAGSVQNYVKTLPRPENYKPAENEETRETEPDLTIRRLIGDYEAISLFLEPLVQLSSLLATNETKTRDHSLGLQLSLFGAPFCYLRHDTETKVDDSQSKIFVTTLRQMSLLSGDFFKFHAILDRRSRGSRGRISGEAGNTALQILRDDRNVTELAWANYYYYVLNTEVGLSNVPSVYNFRYLLPGVYWAANVFLAQPEYVLVKKGLKIVEAILARIDEQSASHETLEIPIYRDLLQSLTRVMIYCDSDKDRKLALKLFRGCIDIFDYRGRYLAISNLYETANHSGIFSLLTSITKQSIIHCLETRTDYFLHNRLERLMKRICRLPNGASSDLVEISDEIIAALNLLRFLVIRDRSDETGVWKIVSGLRNDYLSPLRQGIDLARAHWLVKIKDLEEQNQKDRKNYVSDDCEINISVGGQTLAAMPVIEKIKFCHQAINALDVIESILVRVNECIEENSEKIKQLR